MFRIAEAGGIWAFQGFLGNWFREDTDSLNAGEKSFYSFLISHPDLNYEEAILEMEPGLREKKPEDVMKRLRELRNACTVARGYFRNEIVRRLLTADISVDVYGEGWRNFELYGQKNPQGLKIHPQVPAENAAEEYRKARIS